jgi:hypothetical protein
MSSLLPIKLIKFDKNNIDFNVLDSLSVNYDLQISIDGEVYDYHPKCKDETDCDCYKSLTGYEKNEYDESKYKC